MKVNRMGNKLLHGALPPSINETVSLKLFPNAKSECVRGRCWEEGEETPLSIVVDVEEETTLGGA